MSNSQNPDQSSEPHDARVTIWTHKGTITRQNFTEDRLTILGDDNKVYRTFERSGYTLLNENTPVTVGGSVLWFNPEGSRVKFNILEDERDPENGNPIAIDILTMLPGEGGDPAAHWSSSS